MTYEGLTWYDNKVRIESKVQDSEVDGIQECEVKL